jgi:hypothetical protein
MTSLPFITPPAAPTVRLVGNDASGTLELPVLGGLTTDEDGTLQNLLNDDSSAFVKCAQVADAISKAEGITIVEADKLINDVINGEGLEPAAQDLRLRYAEQIERVGHAYVMASHHIRDAMVTTLIRHRLGRPQWSMADTGGLNRRLVSDIMALGQDETAAENLPSRPRTEEELGKPQRGAGSRPPRTGGESAGS